MLFFHPHKMLFFFCFSVFLYIILHLLNIVREIKKLSFNKIREDVIFENNCKRIRFSKENSYISMKRLKKKKFIVACKQINRKNT